MYVVQEIAAEEFSPRFVERLDKVKSTIKNPARSGLTLSVVFSLSSTTSSPAPHGYNLISTTILQEQKNSPKIYGETKEAVAAARKELEFVRSTFPVQTENIGWVIGKNRAVLRDLEERIGVFRARFDDDSSSVELIGIKENVDDARLVLESHCQYQQVYLDMGEELDDIDRAYNEMVRGKGRIESLTLA